MPGRAVRKRGEKRIGRKMRRVTDGLEIFDKKDGENDFYCITYDWSDSGR